MLAHRRDTERERAHAAAALPQVRFGVLNAGNYGVSQSRKRTFIWGVAPGDALPDWPAPLHVFRSPQLTIKLPGGAQVRRRPWPLRGLWKCTLPSLILCSFECAGTGYTSRSVMAGVQEPQITL